MDRHELDTTGDTRRLIHDLRALRDVAPPPSLLPNVLVAVGLGDAFWRTETPIGPVFVAYNDAGVSALAPADDAAAFATAFRARFGRPASQATQPPAALARAVSRRLAGGVRSHVPFDLGGLSAFERSVLDKAQEIPRGEVRPYSWVAGEIGRPQAARAVGSALGRNPIPLLIPCHRVVRSDGSPGEYSGGGPEVKLRVLSYEGVPVQFIDANSRARERYRGSRSTHIYCYPTCRAAQRIRPELAATFASPAQAEAAGYHPCKLCRPA